MLRITPRMIIEWRMQVRSIAYQSELIWATRLALVHFYPRIPEYFTLEKDELILTQRKYPDSCELEDMVFAVYDHILVRIITWAGLAQVRRERSYSGVGFMRESNIPPALELTKIPSTVPKRINGAHRYRGAVYYDDGKVDFSHYYQARRECYADVPSNLMSLANSQILVISKFPLEVQLHSLQNSNLRYKRYKIRYNNLDVKWNMYDVLINYISHVDPQFSFLKT